MARKLVWEVSAWSQDSTNAQQILNVPYANPTPGFLSLVAATEVEASDRDRIWVERIVGMVYHHGFNAAIAPPITNIKERISVGWTADPSAPVASSVSDPWLRNQAIDNFLWERTKSVDFVTAGGGGAVGVSLSSPVQVPWWSAIDVRVGRLLRPGQFLAYTVDPDASIVSGGSSVVVHGWIRVLISR